ncbi:MAG: hypothetical protein HQK53_06865 [Oligoflexia bacterium]|nr:hypothetical protein [Oligoflexia bacterium]
MNIMPGTSKRMTNLFCLILFIITLVANLTVNFEAHAGIYYQHSFNIDHTNDNAENFSFDTMKNFMCLGATVGQDQNIVIAHSAIFWSKNNKSSADATGSKFSLLEMGPRFIYYFNEAKTVAATVAYHPYVRGTRTLSSAGATAEKISGNSYFGGFSYQLRMSKVFYIGAALIYHVVNITESNVGETNTTVSNTYTSYFPVLEFSIRFK